MSSTDVNIDQVEVIILDKTRSEKLDRLADGGSCSLLDKVTPFSKANNPSSGSKHSSPPFHHPD